MGFHVGYPWLIYDCICIANTWSRKKGSSRFTGMMGWLGWWATTKKTFEFWYPYGPYGLLDGFRNVSSVSGVKQRNPFGKSSGNTKNLWQSYGNHQLSQIVRMVWSSIPISHLRMKWAKGEALNQSLSCLQIAKKNQQPDTLRRFETAAENWEIYTSTPPTASSCKIAWFTEWQFHGTCSI